MQDEDDSFENSLRDMENRGRNVNKTLGRSKIERLVPAMELGFARSPMRPQFYDEEYYNSHASWALVRNPNGLERIPTDEIYPSEIH